VGAEWYPLPLTEWFGWSGLLAILCGLAVLVSRHRREIGRERLVSVLVAVLFLALLWRSARFVEYLVPFTAIALAQMAHLPLDERLHRALPRWRRCAGAALLAWLAASSTIAVAKLRGRPPATQFAGGARWIAERTPPEALVFNTGWDDFPLLYFHNTRNRYVIGLDPTYLAERDPDLYRRWEAIGNGQTARPAAAIRDRFGASIAFTDQNHSAFIEAMKNDPLATKAYEDQECIVYRVGAEPGGARAIR